MSKQVLGKLGFSDKESEVYLALLQHGAMTPAEIAKLTRISRPTVYSVSKELVKKGVVVEDLGGSSRSLIAKQPEDLAILVNREQKALDLKKATVQSAIGELKKIAQSSKYSIPKIVFIPEEEIESHLYKQTPAWNKSIIETKTHYWGFQDPGLVEHFQEWIEWYWQESNPPIVRLLSNESNVEELMKTKGYAKRHIRFWSGAAAFTATTWVMGNYIVMINTRHHPFSLIEIHDAMMAENLRQLFSGIWKSLES
ncbi:MAG: helix-turn-helix domain-containing protein [Patescibacteria group bacterium]